MIPAPEAAVITNIGLEHTQELGGTLTLIAREKSGILKPGCRAVLYRQSDEVTQVIQSVCRQLDIPLRQTDPQELEVLSSGLEGQDFRYRGRGPYRLSLLGSYQLSNAITALEVVQALRDAGWTIPGGGGSPGTGRGPVARPPGAGPAAPPTSSWTAATTPSAWTPLPPPWRASTPAGSSFSSPVSWPIRTGIPCSAVSSPWQRPLWRVTPDSPGPSPPPSCGLAGPVLHPGLCPGDPGTRGWTPPWPWPARRT